MNEDTKTGEMKKDCCIECFAQMRSLQDQGKFIKTCSDDYCKCHTDTDNIKRWWEMEFDKQFIVSQTLDYREWTAVHQENDIKDFIKLVITQELARRKERIVEEIQKLHELTAVGYDPRSSFFAGYDKAVDEAVDIINEEMES